MNGTISRIVADLENHQSFNSQAPISESTLLDFKSLLYPKTLNNDDDSDQIDQLWEELSSHNLSISSLINPITSAMDTGPTSVSLLASNVYLSLVLSPNAPALSLFTPMAFLSLLHSIRRSMKKRNVGASPSSGDRFQGDDVPVNRRRKAGGKRPLNFNNEGEREEYEFDIKSLLSVLDKLRLVLDLVYLERFPDSLKSLIQTIADLPILGPELCGNSGNYKKLCDLCMHILKQLFRPEHGDLQITAADVLKSLTALILLGKSQARTFAIGIVTNHIVCMAEDSDPIRKAVINLPKYLSLKAPEKSEGRALAVESIMEIVKAMQYEHQVCYVGYVLKMSQGKASLRLLAVDLIQMLLISLKDPFGFNLKDVEEYSWGLQCLDALVHRCSDAVAGIRARAMSNLALLVGNFASDERSSVILKKALFKKGLCHGPNNGVNELLRKRCTDEKAAVRKAALLLITKLIALLDGVVAGDLLKTMGLACSDPLVSIRKAAVSALSEAFRTCSDRNVIIEWLHSVPHLITDNETSIQEDCQNLFLELVLDRVASSSSCSLPARSVGQNSNISLESLARELAVLYPNGVLDLLKEINNGEVTPWIRKICSSLGKKKRLKPKIAAALQNIIRTSESIWLSHTMPIEKWTAPPGAWFLLSEVSSFHPKAVDWEFLHHHWQLLDKNGPQSESKSSAFFENMVDESEGVESYDVSWAGDRVLLLQTISNISLELPPEPAAELAHILVKRLEAFTMHSTEVTAHVRALKTLCKRKAFNPEEADTLVMKWVRSILSKASRIIDKYLSNELEANKDNDLFTPRSGRKKGKIVGVFSRSLAQAVTAVYTIGSMIIICPSVDLKDIIPVLHGIITSGRQEPELKKLLGSTSSVEQKAPSLYIQAWLTMGKICLADGKLAKRYIPLFVQELERSECAALRNNIIVMMADFCVRYTALVDCYIGKITKCLRDSCEVVRRQTFILLSRLLQTDYVKWRGVLFLRFLLSLVDESEKIRELADFLFGTILKGSRLSLPHFLSFGCTHFPECCIRWSLFLFLTSLFNALVAKAPLLAYNSFVEAVFVINDCHVHTGRSTSQNSRVESRLFSIKGNDDKSRSKRMHIYTSLLKQMAPEHLLATFAKICAEILAVASDGMLNIDETTGQAVLQDSFQILTCKEIRIPSTRASSSGTVEMDDEGGDGGAAAAAAARGRVITQAVKKSLIQNTIPIFIELKRLLESKNSPLIGSLMECLRILLKDYKNEIDEILVADKQLQKELIYDIQKYEAAKAKSTAGEAAAAMQRATTCRTPGVVRASDVANPQTQSKLSKKLQRDSKLASAMADVAAAATARTVLRDVNQGASTPALGSMSIPRLKSARADRSSDLIESIRIRHSFGSDEEN